MVQSTFSLSWESHKNNICNGIGLLQQNGEFVDMTLAADGHHVKVHQMVMALASPYIKELIKSATTSHPIIFLNKTSYTTLIAILEYIYTGEVLVSVEQISELIQAAQELHIKGLEDMDMPQSLSKQALLKAAMPGEDPENMDDDICYFEVTDRVNTPSQKSNCTTVEDGISEGVDTFSGSLLVAEGEEIVQEVQEEEMAEEPAEKKPRIMSCSENTDVTDTNPYVMQYTVSNQGSLQMILNRYVYYLKHCNRNKSRQWRCVDYLNDRKCPALVFTKDDVVVQRISAHTHPFHDKRILKKVYANAVYTALQDAEKQGKNIKNKSKEKNDD